MQKDTSFDKRRKTENRLSSRNDEVVNCLSQQELYEQQYEQAKEDYQIRTGFEKLLLKMSTKEKEINKTLASTFYIVINRLKQNKSHLDSFNSVFFDNIAAVVP